MVVELKLCKTDNRKFGFRLVGGADFETPLTVSMVMEGSVAEEAGMRVGDVVVRINDIPTTPLSHQEAHEVLTKAGNNFCVGVLRERDLTPCGASPCPTTASDPLDFADDYRNEVLSFPKDPSLVTDDDIAEMISGEAEVLKDHNVIGVNFNKLIPTAGVFKQSEVFQTINEEMRKSKQDLEEEEKRWTTFLQKPQRPVPKQAYKYNVMPQTYRPKIVRQSKPKIAPEIIQQEEQLRSPSPMQAFPVHIPLAHETASPEPRFPTEETKPATPVPEIKIETPEPEQEPVPEPEPSPQITEAKKEETENKEESEEFVKQLAQVQQQLEALSNLPTTIQATLDAITHQLHSLLNPPIAEIKVPRKVETPPKEEEPQPEPEKEPTPPPEEEKYDIPEDANAEHLGPHSEQEFEKIQKEVDKHEEDWEDKFEKVRHRRAGCWVITSCSGDFENSEVSNEIFETFTIVKTFK